MIVLLGIFLGLGLFWAFKPLIGRAKPTLIQRIVRPQFAVDWNHFEWQAFKAALMKLARGAKHERELIGALPDILELLAVSLSAGDSLFAAFLRVVPRANGDLAIELRKVLIGLELGSDFPTELRALSARVPNRHVEELASKLMLANRRGSPLAQLLREHSDSVRAELRNQALAEAGRKETLMLIPLVFLILPVTVLFAIYPSLILLGNAYA